MLVVHLSLKLLQVVHIMTRLRVMDAIYQARDQILILELEMLTPSPVDQATHHKELAKKSNHHQLHQHRLLNIFHMVNTLQLLLVIQLKFYRN